MPWPLAVAQGALPACVSALVLPQGLALGAELPMLGISTLQTMAQGAWRMTGAQRVLAAIDARMGEVYWGQFERQLDGQWLESAGEAVLSPQQALERAQHLQGDWAHVGTGLANLPRFGCWFLTERYRRANAVATG
ncbi:universal bacterial protein YeaZ [Serratia fonticola]|uniref:tRNA threonylcarbamoyladenosine biosynthesis protein TsaB n=1 Tax=Serratia fonticola TaxID=47917 RepID=A0A4U9TER1_SERFO|nr:universal bacterial protein YeaZ [Serratia fonticola]